MNTVSTHTGTEWYRLANRQSVRLSYIKKLCRQIARAFHPERIILFGSQAYGQPNDASDIDLLVVMPHSQSHGKQAADILNHLSVLAPLDVLVRSPEDVSTRLKLGDRFIREIIERGKVMYEADNR